MLLSGQGAERPPAQQLKFWLFVTFILLCFAGGGGSRDDIMSLLYLRPAAVACGAAFLLLPGRIDLDPVRVPLALCLGFAVIMAIQMIPLPPEVWTALPSRDLLMQAADVAGIPQPWRPISISPDLTLNSLASLVVPTAALLGFAALDRQQRLDLLAILLVAAFVSAVVAMAQLAGGESSPLRLYRITNRDAAVGLFANRNHQAMLLVISFPMLAIWAAKGAGGKRAIGIRTLVAAAVGIFLIPMILVTGSRAGLAFGGIAAFGAWLLYFQQARPAMWGSAAWKMVSAGIGGIALAGLLFAFAAPGRVEALQRLLDIDVQGDLRMERVALLTDLARAMLPSGSGFGTFDPLFRIHEPHEALSTFYLNHAHNDLLELAITGGVPALLLLLGGLVWFAAKSWKAFRARSGGTDIALARLGSFIVMLMLAWSLLDYPLRTPIVAMICAIAVGWLGAGTSSAADRPSEPSAKGTVA
jgi:O-antigen ligase